MTKLPAVDRRITLSLSELQIEGNSDGPLFIKWFPREVGCWRDVLQLTDNRRIKYDIIIATTAIGNQKKSVKTRRKLPKASPPLSNSSNFPVSILSRQSRQNNALLKVPTANQSLLSNPAAQPRRCVPKYKNESNKENICENRNGTKTNALRKGDNKINETRLFEHDKSENDLIEQSINMWSDGSVLPQAFLSSNAPQDIRRATYVKEKIICNSILYEHTENIVDDATCVTDKAQIEFSMLLDKLTFTSADVISSSPQSTRRESIDSINSQSIDKHRTFNISRDQFFDTFTVSDLKIPVNAPSALQSTDLHNSSLNGPKKGDGCFLTTDMKDLRALSPIQLDHNDISRDPIEYLKSSAMSMNRSVQTSDCEYFSFEIIPENVKAVKEAGDMYIEISPPKKHLLPKSMFLSKFIHPSTSKIMKHKILPEEKGMKKLHLNDSSKITSTNTSLFFLSYDF